jgi:outer membrane protein assembly factor BamB
MMSKKRAGPAVALMLVLLALAAAQGAAQDWTQWRGANRDGSISSFREPSAWPAGLKQLWKVEIGTGYATPLLVGDRLYLFSRQGEDEVMSALDAASGKVIWRTGYPAPFTVMSAAAKHGPGPKSTPAFAGGRLFSLGMTNIVTAFDAATGRQLWQKPATKAQPLYHTAMSPIVEGGVVIVHTGGQGETALAALDVATGSAKWTWSGDSPAYGSPIVADLGGTRQLITFTHRNLVGISVAEGRLLWQRPFVTQSDTSSQTPILFRDTIIQAGRGNGFTAFRVARGDGAWTTEDVWQTKEVSAHMTNSVVIDGVLYGLSHLNSGQYFALDLATGMVLWKSDPRQAENASILRAGNTIFSLEEDGELVVLKASRTALDVVRRYTVADSATWAQPTIAGNRLYVKDVSTVALWSLN